MKPIDPTTTCTEMTQIVLPSFTNALGTVFGGQIAAWADICAAVAAERMSGGDVVTASMDEIHFLRPVRQGMVVVLRAMVNQSWHTSMEVGVRVDAENPKTGYREHCCSAYLTFVALDDTGGKRRVAPVDTKGDPVLERRAREADYRRLARLRMRKLREQRRLGTQGSDD